MAESIAIMHILMHPLYELLKVTLLLSERVIGAPKISQEFKIFL